MYQLSETVAASVNDKDDRTNDPRSFSLADRWMFFSAGNRSPRRSE